MQKLVLASLLGSFFVVSLCSHSLFAEKPFRAPKTFNLQEEGGLFLGSCQNPDDGRDALLGPSGHCPWKDLVDSKGNYMSMDRPNANVSNALIRANKVCLLKSGTRAISYTLGASLDTAALVQIILTDKKIKKIIGVEQVWVGPQGWPHNRTHPYPLATVTCE